MKISLDFSVKMGYIIHMMKMTMKLLGAKYMVTRAKVNGGTSYFWKLSSAIENAHKDFRRQVVWTLDYHKVYVADGPFRLSKVHPDANNFYTR
jgi:hypothetical protein